MRIEPTKSTPLVVLDTNTKHQIIEGVSIPSDAHIFYKDLQQFIDDNNQSFQDDTEFSFRFDYFNTASSKAIFNLLRSINQYRQSGKNWSIQWKYEEEDDFMHEAGINFQEIMESEFSMVKI